MMHYKYLPDTDLKIHELIKQEEQRQKEGLELIASENYISPSVMEPMASVLNNRYSEGYPGARYYGGQEVMDELETEAIDRAKQLFNAGHANVQPHSGSSANLSTYFGLIEPGDTILGMDLSHGGHLTHGHPVTHAAKIFNFVGYKMKNVETGEIDYDQMRDLALAEKPKILLAGFSSYPRELDYDAMREIATEVGAYAVADMAHIAGLIVADVLKSPFDSGFDVILSTTHKTLRGPRGGMIVTREKELGLKIDKSVFPSFQGGPIMQMIAAKAVAFKEALQPEFKTYAKQVLDNAQALAEEFVSLGVKLITGGTDNHLLLIDCIASWNVSGQELQERLDSVSITVNKNVIPDDPRGARDPSGIRVGVPALTTRGMAQEEMKMVARLIDATGKSKDESALGEVSEKVKSLSIRFPIPGVE